MTLVAHEVALSDVYFSPMLIASLLGAVIAFVVGRVLDHYRLSKYFYQPAIVLVAFAVIATVFISTFIIPA